MYHLKILCVVLILCIEDMMFKGSPKLLVALSKAAQKKNSPKASTSKKRGGKDVKVI